MELLAAWPDIEDIVLELLAPAGETRLATPTVITPPLVIVARVGGLDDAITDAPRVQVDVFGATRRQAADTAEHCRQLILAAPATTVAGVSIDYTATETAPVYVPYGDQDVQRYTGEYRIELRRS